MLGRTRRYKPPRNCWTETPAIVEQIGALIIDEHPHVRRALAERLATTESIQVVDTAESIKDALDKMESLHPDVVLLGYRVDDGIRDVRLISRLAERLAQWQAALLVLTTYSVADEREAVLEAGARRYLLKDIDTDHLLQEINCALREAHRRRTRPKRGNGVARSPAGEDR